MIHLCFNPQVTTENSKLSQIFIDDLAKENAFTDHDLYLLHAFLKRLRGPVCFVAHNGAKFIYSVLRKYIQAYDYKFAMDYVCVDTIRGFKTGSELPMVSLKDLYENTTGKHANIHVSAEMDMKMLVECACKDAATFIAWANSSHTPFIPVSNSNCTIDYWDDVKPSI